MKSFIQKDIVQDLLKGVLLTFVILALSMPVISKAKVSTIDGVPEGYRTILVTISSGDRAWNIQQELTPNDNIQKLLWYAGELNNKSLGEINIGEKVVFLEKER